VAHAPLARPGDPARNGNLSGRGIFDKSHISQAGSARRLVIEASYSL
jgi:hypothetical protein